MSWKNIKVRHADGRTGVIKRDYEGFMHRVLSIQCEDGAEGRVQLNADGQDSGDEGWEWLCADYDPALGGPKWLPLGDQNRQTQRLRSRPVSA